MISFRRTHGVALGAAVLLALAGAVFSTTAVASTPRSDAVSTSTTTSTELTGYQLPTLALEENIAE